MRYQKCGQGRGESVEWMMAWKTAFALVLFEKVICVLVTFEVW
jgi:hypothetical protein